MTQWSAYRKLQLIANGGAVGLGVDWWRVAAKEGCERIAEFEKINEAQAEQLGQAYERIAELEAEVGRLKKQNGDLSVIKNCD